MKITNLGRVSFTLPFSMPFDFILASGSPRRIGLLKQLGANFRQVISRIEEVHDGMDPVTGAERVALQKAWIVHEDNPGSVVIGADTVVVTPEGEILGKPEDRDEAVEILMKLSGRVHTVITAIAVVGPSGEESVASELTKVWMRRFSRAEAGRYVASDEPMDKAGAYGIQVRGALLVERIEGCYFNVVGLPLVLLQRLLQECGYNISDWLGPDPSRTDYS